MGHQGFISDSRVHCRIGSLEIIFHNKLQTLNVHCRIDSQKNSVETAV